MKRFAFILAVLASAAAQESALQQPPPDPQAPAAGEEIPVEFICPMDPQVRSSPLSAIRRVLPLDWYLLQAGQTGSNPTELLQADTLPGTLQELTPHFDWILIDTPPVAPLTDALLLAHHADATLLVVRADQTPREAVDESMALLGHGNVLGIVFNGADGLNRVYSKYYGYYGKK